MSDDGERFFLLSVERTGQAPWGPRCVWWRPGAMGYTTSIDEAGRYTREEVARHADPPHHLAIPCRAVDVPASRAKALAAKALRISRFDPPAANPRETRLGEKTKS
jgi:hypothetical protein